MYRNQTCTDDKWLSNPSQKSFIFDIHMYVSLPSCLPRAHPCRQISNVANGLHSHNVIYGPIAGVRNCSKSCSATMLTPVQRNILMDGSGHTCIVGFGHTMTGRLAVWPWTAGPAGKFALGLAGLWMAGPTGRLSNHRY